MQQIEENLRALYEDKAEYMDDYALVTEPFGLRPSMNVSRRSVGGGYGYESTYTDGDGSESNEDLRWVFYLTVIFGAMEIIIIYGKYDFLNVRLFLISAYRAHLPTLNLPAEPFRPGIHPPDPGPTQHQRGPRRPMAVHVRQPDMEPSNRGQQLDRTSGLLEIHCVFHHLHCAVESAVGLLPLQVQKCNPGSKVPG